MGKSTITYNGSVIAETEESGSVDVIYDGNTIATVAEGETKTLKCAGKVMRSNLYIGARTLLCEMSKMISDIIVAVAGGFPAEPSSYTLIETHTASRLYTITEAGWYQIEVFGASGSGGDGTTSGSSSSRKYRSGGGGGGGGYACSRVKMNVGDYFATSIGNMGAATSAKVYTTADTWHMISVTSGANGDDGSATGAVGGAGGVATGGNYLNADGGAGGDGKNATGSTTKGGAGGAAGYTGGNAGGAGGDGTSLTSGKAGEAGSKGFVKIYKGDSTPAFPVEPTSYNLIGTYKTSHTWTAPENGYFQIETFGASGNGGNGYYGPYYASGAGGGGGGYACSRIKMNAGDTINLTVGAVGATSSATVNSSLETYTALSVTSGANGGNASGSSGGTGGAGGSATGGNYANNNGGTGGNGSVSIYSPISVGGAGGAAGYTGGNVGGQGAGSGNGVYGEAGKAGFFKIYRGNTNISGGGSTETFTRLNYIESTGTQYIDTGCVPSNTVKVVIKLTPVSSGMSENAIFGSTWAANGFFLMFYQNMLRWHSKGASVDVSAFNTAGENEIECTPTKIAVNGTSYSLSGTGTDSTNPITLFYAGGYAYAKNGIYKLHACKVYDNDVLIKDYVPVLDENDVPCLYDEVSGTYSYNEGTGAFLYG